MPEFWSAAIPLMQTATILLPPALLLAAALCSAALLRAVVRRRLLSLTLALATAFLVLLGALAVLPDGWVRATPQGDVGRADAFVALAIGLGPAGSAGESNVALARWLIEHNPDHRPAIVQEGIYLALRELQDADPCMCVEEWVIRLPHREGVYVDTAGAALQAWAILELRGLRRPVLLAHDLHLQRAAWTFEPFGLQEVIVPDLPGIPFDARSPQHWGTRSRVGWLAWELLFARPLSLRPRSALLLALLAVGLLVAVRYRHREDRLSLDEPR
jgi:hypothetical protein